MKNKIKRLVQYFSFNGFFAFAIYRGVVLGNDGFCNVAVFMGWLTAVTAIILMFDGIIKQAELNEKLRNPTVPAWFDTLFDLSILGVLVFYGYIWLPVFYFFHIVLLGAARIKAKRFFDEGKVVDDTNPGKSKSAVND